MPLGFAFPWPLLVIPVLMGVAMMSFMALRLAGGGIGPGCGMGAHRNPNPVPAPTPTPPDPMVTLRDRWARGEIDSAEFDSRLDGLLRSDPGKTMPWWNR
ncbi:MAG: hypothetical protein NVSMB29_11150 [Candidatus Dormibacteria bacterium]